MRDKDANKAFTIKKYYYILREDGYEISKNKLTVMLQYLQM